METSVLLKRIHSPSARKPNSFKRLRLRLEWWDLEIFTVQNTNVIKFNQNLTQSWSTMNKISLNHDQCWIIAKKGHKLQHSFIVDFLIQPKKSFLRNCKIRNNKAKQKELTKAIFEKDHGVLATPTSRSSFWLRDHCGGFKQLIIKQ